jgi:hypothetical protein
MDLNSRCPLCGKPNLCGLCASNSDVSECWCRTERTPDDLLRQISPELHGKACVCQLWVKKFNWALNGGSSLLPGDFYLDEDGLMVYRNLS